MGFVYPHNLLVYDGYSKLHLILREYVIDRYKAVYKEGWWNEAIDACARKNVQEQIIMLGITEEYERENYPCVLKLLKMIKYRFNDVFKSEIDRQNEDYWKSSIPSLIDGRNNLSHNKKLDYDYARKILQRMEKFLDVGVTPLRNAEFISHIQSLIELIDTDWDTSIFNNRSVSDSDPFKDSTPLTQKSEDSEFRKMLREISSEWPQDKGILQKDNTILSDKFLYEIHNNNAEIIRRRTTEEHLIIPSTINTDQGRSYPVTRLASRAFEGNNHLKWIYMSPSLKEVGEECFKGCKDLTHVYFSRELKSLKSGIFRNCTNLKYVDMPDYVSEIPLRMFSDCTSITKILMPLALETIEPFAFYNCSSLYEINFPSSIEKIEHDSFKGCHKLGTVELHNPEAEIDFDAFEPSIHIIEDFDNY